MVLAWVALAWGWVSWIILIKQDAANIPSSKFDGKHQPSRPTADDNDVCICIFHVRNKRSLVHFCKLERIPMRVHDFKN